MHRKPSSFVLLLLLVIFCSSSLLGQDAVITKRAPSPKNLFGFQLGMQNSRFHDRNFSPLNYVGKGLALALSYQRNTDLGNLIQAEVNYSQNVLQSDASRFLDAYRYTLHLKAGYLYGIGELEGRLKLHVGGKYHTYLDAVFYDGVESITFSALHGIDASAQATYELPGGHRLRTAVSLPVFGLLVRPPYSGWDKFIVDNEDSPARVFFRGKWASLNRFGAFNWELDYAYALSLRWSLNVRYGFSYFRTQTLDPTVHVNNQFSLGAQFQF